MTWPGKVVGGRRGPRPTGRPGTSQGAPLRPWLVRLLPLGMLASTVLLIVFELWSAPLLWHLWILLVWIVGMINSFRVWRGSRDA